MELIDFTKERVGERGREREILTSISTKVTFLQVNFSLKIETRTTKVKSFFNVIIDKINFIKTMKVALRLFFKLTSSMKVMEHPHNIGFGSPKIFSQISKFWPLVASKGHDFAG